MLAAPKLQAGPGAPVVRRLAFIIVLMLAIAAVPGAWIGAGQWLAPAAGQAAREAGAAGSSTVERAQAALALLQRQGLGPAGESVEVIYAPPDYFVLTNQDALGLSLGAADRVVFLVSESVHYGDLPAPLRPILRVDGNLQFLPTEATVVMDAVHHRASVLAYDRQAIFGSASGGPSSLELILPAAADGARPAVLFWQLPISVMPSAPAGGKIFGLLPGLTVASLLALFGGLLASMWPCLFQLTAYFIPSLAGLSMEEASKPTPALRKKVVSTALAFVIGIVVVYTAAGALVGYLAGSLGSGTLIETYSRPLSIVAGIVIIGMALRTAVRARAPMVCHMPIVSLAGRGEPGLLGTMVLGLAFATGCMSCFGAALGLGMLTYTMATGSALTGAAMMFLFSLGIAVPLVMAAVAMAQVLPMLGRLERIAPWMALTSSVIMIGFALLLITDNYHVVSDAVGLALSPAL